MIMVVADDFSWSGIDLKLVSKWMQQIDQNQQFNQEQVDLAECEDP